jgi:hypothetical protein
MYDPLRPIISPEYVATDDPLVTDHVGFDPSLYLAYKIPLVPHGKGDMVGIGVAVATGLGPVLAGCLQSDERSTSRSRHPETSHVSVDADVRIDHDVGAFICSSIETLICVGGARKIHRKLYRKPEYIAIPGNE